MKAVFALLVLIALATAQEESPTIRQLCEAIHEQPEGCVEEGMEDYCEKSAAEGFSIGSEKCLEDMDVEVNETVSTNAIACCCCAEEEMIRYE
ncbi:unnamed protein product [Cyprideis torosa]|uniref:Uncharacterized protein n=1 Tax=Cyprideis torosa TaxID=163714 RepID=A0A7R8ZNE9_9CRUS|nr:unnamed protein product [Cyprideis torosa]CAG0897840.1 unnamed protein product [Cyprideis torosa]